MNQVCIGGPADGLRVPYRGTPAGNYVAVDPLYDRPLLPALGPIPEEAVLYRYVQHAIRVADQYLYFLVWPDVRDPYALLLERYPEPAGGCK